MGLTDHWFGVGQSHYWFGMGRTDYWVWVGQAEDFKGGLEKEAFAVKLSVARKRKTTAQTTSLLHRMAEETACPSIVPKTYVFFDTETTGLRSKKNPPEITEICFVAFSRNELQSTMFSPRVINKLVLCFNPRKAISPKAIEISGLTNSQLEDFQTFDEQTVTIREFLTRLPGPLCLVAHNGDRFDFPILTRHLRRAGVDIASCGDIRCVDSQKVFKKLCSSSSYALGRLYRAICHSEPNEEHCAEGDSQMIVDIVRKLGPTAFLDECMHFETPLKEYVD
ncbi:hypothetical protein RRG08_013027 [Elysia crispata]|uniref:Exonuclease domain-containing protein n=1 Tax=Elysia crispata TaxID=231223 RepID=A0AAE1DPW9_9GAST|nr:hypothetical protein RRG08_013027 [Elysia crispata]